MLRKTSRILLAAFALFAASFADAGDRTFSVPLDHLKTWAAKVVVRVDVEITGNSKVHQLANDCEMHFGAKAPTYNGDPPGVVLEPMNLCVEAFPNKTTHSNKDWETFGKSLKGVTVQVEGVPRVWPEHLVGGSASNPSHAWQVHPMTELRRGNKVFDFRRFVYAPEGFDGGVKAETARKLLTETEVSVVEQEGMVNVDFDSGPIGNFTILHLTLSTGSIEEVDGSHRMNGEVVLGRKEKIPVRLVTVAGTEINNTMAQLRQGKPRKVAFDALVLFSLSPEALLRAAKDSAGNQIQVQQPLQLIVYGQPDLAD